LARWSRSEIPRPSFRFTAVRTVPTACVSGLSDHERDALAEIERDLTAHDARLAWLDHPLALRRPPRAPNAD
jgi:hypothetical protein